MSTATTTDKNAEISRRVVALVRGGRDVMTALRMVCGDEAVDSLIESVYVSLREKAVR